MSDEFTGADIAAGMSGGGDPSASTPDSAVAPTSIEPTAQPGAGTTVPAVQAQQPPAKPAGPIPFDVHKTALENARKERDEWDKQYGWARQIDQNEFRQVQGLARRLSSENAEEAVAAVSELIAEMTARPTHAAAVRSLIAKSLGGGRQAPTMPEPDVDITDANGNVVGGTFSHKAMMQFGQAVVQQALAKVDEKYAPVVKTHEEVKSERELLKAKAAASEWEGGFTKELTTYPGFADNKFEIGKDVARQIQEASRNPNIDTDNTAFLEAITLRAYNRVVLPKLDASSRQAVAHDLATKGGGSGVVPGRAPVGAPKRSDDGRFTADEIRDAFNQRKLG